MASYSVVTDKHATLVANTVDTVTLSFVGTADNIYPDQVEILNRGTTDPIYFRTDGVAPTVAGDDCKIVIPGGALAVPIRVAPVTVKLISAGAMAYSTDAS